MSATLPLRDVHLPAAPGWWPPAPGWWLLVASILAALLLLVMIWSRRQRRCRQWQTLFDEGVAAAGTPAARIAAASELLRRAVRHCAPQSVHLQGCLNRWFSHRENRELPPVASIPAAAPSERGRAHPLDIDSIV